VEIAMVLVILSSGLHTRRAALRMIKQACSMTSAALRYIARFVVIAGLPTGGTLLEWHGDGSVWLVVKPIRPRRAPVRSTR
jgi:hypothetical protein